uniref:hypothetical protein n=1 Tax=Treponema endosymbiont of Eucomonympha sp. TaxID=1580831 RepID=UPI001E2B14FA
DPVAGRCSGVFAGSARGRNSLGIEINPVGWLYGKAKLQPAPKDTVLERLNCIYAKRTEYHAAIEGSHEFFRLCFCDEVLKFLFACRNCLNWRNDSVDATLAAIILVCLHGKLGEGLSNQMKMTKAMSRAYSIKWWKEHGFETPPEINPRDFLTKKIEWRYAKGTPNFSTDSRVVLGDSTREIIDIAEYTCNRHKYSLLFTSPPVLFSYGLSRRPVAAAMGARRFRHAFVIKRETQRKVCEQAGIRCVARRCVWIMLGNHERRRGHLCADRFPSIHPRKHGAVIKKTFSKTQRKHTGSAGKQANANRRARQYVFKTRRSRHCAIAAARNALQQNSGAFLITFSVKASITARQTGKFST